MATELEAVNILLVGRGVTQVTDINSGHPDVSEAKLLLSVHKRGINSKKWWYNTEKDIDLSPNTEGFILLPPRAVGLDNDSNYIIMQGKLYDPATRTNVFTETVEGLTIIFDRIWEELPIQAYDFIVALAKEEFIRPLESQILSGQAEKDIRRTQAICDIADYRYKDVAKETANPLMTKWRQKMLQR